MFQSESVKGRVSRMLFEEKNEVKVRPMAFAAIFGSTNIFERGQDFTNALKHILHISDISVGVFISLRGDEVRKHRILIGESDHIGIRMGVSNACTLNNFHLTSCEAFRASATRHGNIGQGRLQARIERGVFLESRQVPKGFIAIGDIVDIFYIFWIFTHP